MDIPRQPLYRTIIKNIFDIAVSLGLPLVLYALIYGSVVVASDSGSVSASVQSLRIVLVGITIAVLALMLLGRSRMGLGKALVLVGIYIGWITWIGWSAFVS